MVSACETRMSRTTATFVDAFDPKNNAFGFLRLVLAVLVVFSHSFPLGGFGIDPLEALTKGRHTIGLVAVAMFFVLSGFLVCRSASQTASVPRFLWHRFLRIFPGYWICLLICGFVVAPFVAFGEYDSFVRVFAVPRGSSQDFVMGNAALFHFEEFSIPGIFYVYPTAIAGLLRNNPFPFAINGSLWTLPFEVFCYLGVATLTVVGVLRRARSLILALFIGLWCLYAFVYIDPITFREAFPYPGLLYLVMLPLYFCAGCLCFLYIGEIPFSRLVFIASVLLTGVSLLVGAFGLIAPVAMTYAFLWIAFRLPLGRFEAKGDFSYGVYIYAFPVQQGLAFVGIQEMGFGAYFASSLLAAFALAILSYRLVEAPCLRLKNLRFSTFPISKTLPVAEQSGATGGVTG